MQIFFCQGGSQVWVKEKVGETGAGAFDLDPPRVSSKCWLSFSADETAFITHSKVSQWPPHPPRKLPATATGSGTVQLAQVTERYYPFLMLENWDVKTQHRLEGQQVSSVPQNACIAHPNIFAIQQRWIPDSLRWQGFICDLKMTVMLTPILGATSEFFARLDYQPAISEQNSQATVCIH